MLATGWRSRESFGCPSWRIRHGKRRSENQTQPLPRYSLQQVGIEPVQRPAREGWRLDRATGGKHRSAHAPTKPERSSGRRYRRPGDRHVRSAHWRTTLPGARTAGQAEAYGEDATCPCVIRDGGIAEDDSLPENDERVGLHPLD